MFVEFYRENCANKDAQETAKTRLVTNMVSSPVFGSNKLVDIDSTDMESLLGNKFYPGLIYTFVYTSEGDLINGILFGDYLPIVLCCSSNGRYMEGLNFNMIPNEHRAVLLETLDKVSGNHLSEHGPEEAMSGQLSISNTLAGMLADEKSRLAVFNVFEQQTGCSIAKAFRKYKLSHMDCMRLIEYSDYKYIPVLYYEGSIRDANLLKIQQETISKD